MVEKIYAKYRLCDVGDGEIPLKGLFCAIEFKDSRIDPYVWTTDPLAAERRRTERSVCGCNFRGMTDIADPVSAKNDIEERSDR